MVEQVLAKRPRLKVLPREDGAERRGASDDGLVACPPDVSLASTPETEYEPQSWIMPTTSTQVKLKDEAGEWATSELSLSAAGVAKCRRKESRAGLPRVLEKRGQIFWS